MVLVRGLLSALQLESPPINPAAGSSQSSLACDDKRCLFGRRLANIAPLPPGALEAGPWGGRSAGGVNRG